MIAYYILFVFFGLFSLVSFIQFLVRGIEIEHAALMFISAGVAALASGKIF